MISSRAHHYGPAGNVTEYETGTMWGEMQFLGLEETRTATIQAQVFCEIASLRPGMIQEVSSSLRKR